MNLRSKLPPRLQKFATRGALIKLPLLPFALIVVGIYVLLRPFVIIQIYKVEDWRIGHMVPNLEMVKLHVRDRNYTKKRKIKLILFFPSENASNNYYKKMIVRDSCALDGHFGFLIYYLASHFSFFVTYYSFEDPKIMEVLFKNPPTLQFTDSELQAGFSFLDSFGLGTRNKFVCLLVRDSSYLSTVRPSSKKFTKHSTRDSEVATYLTAAESLAERGYTVFRMGVFVKNPLISENAKIIDYATNGMRTEFLDIFLGAHCTFCISSGAGWDEIPKLFKRPTMFLNTIPYWQSHHFIYEIIRYPKLLIDLDDGHVINFTESINRNIASEMHAGRILESGATYKDLDPDQIREAVQEMADRVEGKFKPSISQLVVRDQINHEISTNTLIQPSPHFYPIRAEFASSFLTRNPHFFV